jgi:hypothetical protein
MYSGEYGNPLSSHQMMMPGGEREHSRFAQHCQVNNLTLMQKVVYDWLDETLLAVAESSSSGTSGC